MDYLGKTVRLKSEFIELVKIRDENSPYKLGTVVDQVDFSDDRILLVVDDQMFGTWKAVSSNIEVISKH